MGRELLSHDEVFADRIRECAQAIEAESGWSLVTLLESGRALSTVDEIQPALWAMQVALAAVWRDWGVEPDLVIGHSMGEIAAAVTSGALSVRDGASVVCRRSALLTDLSSTGAMWAIQLGETAAREAIGEFAGQVCVGVVNSDASTVLSGDPSALVKVIEPLRRKGIFCRRVQVDYASHGPQVEPLRPRLRDLLAHLRPRPGRVPIQSTVLDRVVDGAMFDAEYWAQNLRRPVLFASALRAALADRPNSVFVEISPHPVLLPAVEDGIQASGADAVAVGSLQRDAPELESLLTGLGTAYVRGCDPDWQRVYEGGRTIAVPSYPWQRKRFWVSGQASRPMAPASRPLPAAELAGRGETTPVAPASSVDAVLRHLRDRAAEVLATAPEQINPALPLTLAGLDSLLAGKLRSRLEQETNLRLSVRDLLGTLPLVDLARRLHERAEIDSTRQEP